MGDSTSPNPHTIIVSTEYGDVTVHKMPLSDYRKILGALKNLPESVKKLFGDLGDGELEKMSATDFAATFPALLAESWGDVITLIAVPTDKDSKFLGKLDLADAVDVVSAALELNDVQRIITSIKKVLALRAKVARPKKQS